MWLVDVRPLELHHSCVTGMFTIDYTALPTIDDTLLSQATDIIERCKMPRAKLHGRSADHDDDDDSDDDDDDIDDHDDDVEIDVDSVRAKRASDVAEAPRKARRIESKNTENDDNDAMPVDVDDDNAKPAAKGGAEQRRRRGRARLPATASLRASQSGCECARRVVVNANVVARCAHRQHNKGASARGQVRETGIGGSVAVRVDVSCGVVRVLTWCDAGSLV
jgi:hypothetical protein